MFVVIVIPPNANVESAVRKAYLGSVIRTKWIVQKATLRNGNGLFKGRKTGRRKMLSITSNAENPQQHRSRRQIHLDSMQINADNGSNTLRSKHCQHTQRIFPERALKFPRNGAQISEKAIGLLARPLSDRNWSFLGVGMEVGWARFGRARARVCRTCEGG